MILRVGLLVVGLLLLVFLGWGAISSWVTVFTVGPDAPLSASGRGTGEGETTALVGAIVFTVFALLSAGAVLASAYVLRRRRA
ncbi:hypothetical protein Q9S36_33380 [Microbacterium sp. ARD31]|uniref:hypothetical protein n=1 Tax=unclassified Microbacterium TaxID=2609290 RepID=UPI00203C554A|nr:MULTISPECIES: hypothetical protein [unclassified Microbacterium]MDT0185085.1 hypothetical protein [Microbacterium sp. ARD31]